jgi:xylulose-5-phosphate/fructose-6-phosphate phosphoketolase
VCVRCRYKIAGPTVLARIPHDELAALFKGYGHRPVFVEGHEPAKMHQLMAAALEDCLTDIMRIQKDIRANGFKDRPIWPMVIVCIGVRALCV